MENNEKFEDIRKFYVEGGAFDGEATLGENIADLGSLKIAIEAFKDVLDLWTFGPLAFSSE